MSSAVPVEFVARDEVLDPVATVGLGPVARTLAERVLLLDDERLQQLRGIAGQELLVVLGESEALPWVEGCLYLGRDAGAPRLLLSTALRPAVASELFERALLLRWPNLQPPIAVVASPRRVLSLAAALPIQRHVIRAWLEAP